MNRTGRLFIEACDNRKTRVTIAAALGAIVWGIVLAVLGRGLHARPVPERKLEQPPLAMSIVELPVPAPTLSVAATHTSRAVIEPHTPSPSKPPQSKSVHAQTQPVLRTPSPSLTPAPETQAKAPEALATSPNHSDATTAEQAPTTSTTSSNSPAHAISQPLPTVPDDLREEAYQTVAIARLVIHTDGSVAVDLIKPTQYPRLNQILIETLRGWRFFPATQDGHPVETQQDVRVHFNVS